MKIDYETCRKRNKLIIEEVVNEVFEIAERENKTVLPMSEWDITIDDTGMTIVPGMKDK